MKILLSQALSFRNVYNSLKEIKFPFKISYGLTKIQKSLEVSYDYYQDTLTSIIKEYSEKDENGNPITVESGFKIESSNIDKCNNKINELSQLECEVYDFKIAITDLEQFNISAEQIEGIAPFIEES